YALAPPGTGNLMHRWELSCVLLAGIGSTLSGVPSVYLRTAQKPLAAGAFQLGEFLAVALLGILFVGPMGRGLRGALEALGLASALNGLAAAGFIFFYLHGPCRRAELRES